MNRNKGILAAMHYLTKVKPRKYKLVHSGDSVTIYDLSYVRPLEIDSVDFYPETVTCGFCSKPCGNDHCITKDKK